MWDTLILGDYICMKCKMPSSKRNTNTWVPVEDNSKNLITGRTQWRIWGLESYIKSHAWWKSLRSQNNSFWFSVIPLLKEISDMSNRDDNKYLDIETNIWAERDFMRSLVPHPILSRVSHEIRLPRLHWALTDGSWKPPRMETAQPLQAACSTV